jgi:hypothetical protein
MWAAAWVGRAIVIGTVSSGLLPVAGCAVETSAPSSSSGGGTAYPGAYGGGGGGGSSSGAPASAQPMLVDVDPNRTMTAQPGQGVGVFTEYVTGGHWHIWWTCDTNQTSFDCSFDVTVSVGGGPVTNAVGEGLAATDRIVQSSAGQIEIVTQTSTQTSGVSFDTSPGAVITLDGKMNGQDDGAFLFFVQGGQVNGGYQGVLTDPLMLEPLSP